MQSTDLVQAQKKFIEAACKRSGLSQAALAKKAGVSTSTINRFMSSPSPYALSHKTVSKIEGIVGIHFSDIEPESSEMRIAEPNIPGDTIPIIGYARGGNDGLFFDNGTIVDYVERPPFLKNTKGAFAIRCVGESMAPRYYPDDLLYINPALGLKTDAFVVIEKNNGEALVKKFLKRDNGHYLFEQLNPIREMRIKADDVKQIYRIVGSSEG